MVDKTSSIHSINPNIHKEQSFGLPKIASASQGSEHGLSIKSIGKNKVKTEVRNSLSKPRNSKFTSTGNKYKTHHIEVENVTGQPYASEANDNPYMETFDMRDHSNPSTQPLIEKGLYKTSHEQTAESQKQVQSDQKPQTILNPELQQPPLNADIEESMSVDENQNNDFESMKNERLSQSMEQPERLTNSTSRVSGISLVKNLLRARKKKEIQREELVRRQRGTQPVRFGYSNEYFNFHSQSLKNIQHAYNTGDRSEKARRLTETSLRSLPPLEMLEDYPQPKAIEYKQLINQKPRENSMNDLEESNGKGWQFATQIEDMGDEPFDSSVKNQSSFEQLKVQLSNQAKGQASLVNRAISMLDSQFSTDLMLAEYGHQNNRLAQTQSQLSHINVKNPIQTMNVYTSSKSSIWEDGVSQQYPVRKMLKAPGIKDRAWDGISTGSGMMVHRDESDIFRPMREKSDNLPVALQAIPKHIYVNSQSQLRRTADVKNELILNKINHKDFNPFLSSKQGKLYYKGVLSGSRSLVAVDNPESRNESALAIPDYGSEPSEDVMSILVANHHQKVKEREKAREQFLQTGNLNTSSDTLLGSRVPTKDAEQIKKEEQRKAKLKAEQFLRQQKAKREKKPDNDVEVDRQLLEFLKHGAPRMSEHQRQTVDRIYHNFIDNMYSKRSKSNLEENPEKYTEEQVEMRAQLHREQLNKILKKLEPLDKRFYKKLKQMRRESLPAKLRVTMVDSSSREQTATKKKRAEGSRGRERSKQRDDDENFWPRSQEREVSFESPRKSTGRI